MFGLLRPLAFGVVILVVGLVAYHYGYRTPPAPEPPAVSQTTPDREATRQIVREYLIEHPEVSLCAVIGVPHEQYGEELKAFIVREPGSRLDAEAVIAFAREHIAAYKYPRIVEFCDALPMNATGKILKTHLRKQP